MSESHITDERVDKAVAAYLDVIPAIHIDWYTMRRALEAAFPEESPVYAFTEKEWQEWLAQHPILQHNS